MTLKSALQDVRATTLAAIQGLLGKLTYFASLRGGERDYLHWGLSLVHGEEPSEQALRTAHGEVLTRVLRAPLRVLLDDLHETCQESGSKPSVFVKEMRGAGEDLLPPRRDEAAARHLSSVLAALSSLEKAQERATRSVSSPRQPPDPALPLPGDVATCAPAPATRDATAG
jgi:hypothetical protein